MPNFDDKYWNLTQAAAWVVYRKRELVERFSKETADSWRALRMFPKMHGYKRVDGLDDLVKKLTLDKLKAWGRREGPKDDLEAIPAREWNDLEIRPPHIYRSTHIDPWTGLRFESSDLKKLWRSLLETQGRTKYNWEILENMWRKIDEQLPDASQNEKIEELQFQYEAQHDLSPGRSTIQNQIKKW